MKDFFLALLSVLMALFVLFLGGEAAIRAWHFYKNTFSDQMNPQVIALDAERGWLPVRNYLYKGELLDAGGVRYPVDIETDAEGYRAFGDLRNGERKKVLFLGDSFTHAMQVSNQKTYFGLLQEELGIEAFAFGVDGYGTLQEYLLLDSIIDDVEPVIVVLQFCPNDFINNHYDLELASAFNNNGLRRPYFEEGQIQYKTPTNFSAIREFAASYSEFLYFILNTIDRLKTPPVNSSENLIEEQGLSYPLFKESVEVTDQLLEKIRARVPPGTPIYAFSTNHGAPYHEEFKRLSDKNGIEFVDGTSQALRAAESKGITTRAADKAHWNNQGHQIVAEVLKSYFEENW